ncbi:hypothetical protein SDC9_191492 [bioreactor metagenome]|uniref:Uncharacterized protein n=1 Tax=bioreactor metagenome TaxID=1076179 RepID=A0A645HY14_9ZZZZ
MPEPRLRTYLELVLAPGQPPYAKWVHAGRDGVFDLCDFSPAEFHHAVKRFPGGYRVEAAIAFRELPGYLRGNAPRAGETIFFMPVRTDRNGDSFRATAPVPFLYDGHNIHGYMKGTLQ